MGHIVRVNEPPPPHIAPRPDGTVELATPGEGVPLVYLSAEAFRRISHHIGWGTTTAENTVEQGGLLIGQIFREGDGEELFALIECVLEAEPSHSTQISIDMDHATWVDLLRRFHALEAEGQQRPSRILGWYHTHPNRLDVFMSGVDRRTQRDFFGGPEFFALVFNPHRKLWKAFRGAECIECPAVVLAGDAAPPGGPLDKGEEAASVPSS